jgi:hypothetical protein
MCSVPDNALIAAMASLRTGISTNPNPRGWPL